MKRIFFIALLALTLPFASCDDLFNNLEDLKPTEEEIIKGLKTALEVGTDTSVARLSGMNGYFKDQAVKILLPPEAKIIYDNKDNALLQAFGVDDIINDLILSMNRAAEDAAPEAQTIFKDAITSLTISQGLDILNGKDPSSAKKTETFDSSAATHYLANTTRPNLVSAFAPKINTSLGKPLLGSYSTTQIWTKLTTNYNKVAPLLGLNKVESDLGAYVTGKAVDGLFLKVAKEENEIRRDPYKWIGEVGDILKKVFGQTGG